MTDAVARANSNVALAKYWGKRDESLNLPYTGSISITMAGLETTAGVSFRPALRADRVLMNGAVPTETAAQRVSTFLDLVRRMGGESAKAEVQIQTNFPVNAGLASSASTFAALAVAATRAAGLALSPQQLSVLARRGSGSAARSVFGGYVEWMPGEVTDGSDSHAVQIAPPDHWPLGVVVAIVDEGSKPIGSREAMACAVKQSPFFPAWLQSHEADLEAVRRGVLERDLTVLGEAAESNCLKMHAVSMATRPPAFFWTPATVAVMECVRSLRREGLPAYFTIDAGPQVKVLCPLSERSVVAERIGSVAGVHRVLSSEPGGGPQVLESA